MASKQVRATRCVYERGRGLIPLGRARTRCPRCGAFLHGEAMPDDLVYHAIQLVDRATLEADDA